MIVTLAAALSLAASLAIEVPYLPQTDALCGGAAAAMVFRYWGDAHADALEFAPLVDRRAGGIADTALVEAVRRRGWRPLKLEGGLAGLRARLEGRQPVIVLLADHGARYHYVVVTGKTDEGVSIHDPSWGPSRAIKDREFERLWRASDYWGLVILPPEDGLPPANGARSDPPREHDRCDVLLSSALGEIRRTGFDEAESILHPLRTACPASAGPWRELAGVRFAQRRWKDAAALAGDALARDPHDAYALDVLGSSLFMQDDAVGALRAWNQIDKPRVNLVRIEGIRHTRYQTVAEVLAIQPNMLLTAQKFEHARRRLEELPDRTTARIALRPEADNFATVDVVVVERGGVPRGGAEWAATGLRSAVTRSVSVSAPGSTGQGEVWSADWGFWPNRPSVGLAFATPRVGGLPGVWRVDASWDAQRFASSGLGLGAAATVRESRLHGGLTVSDWLTAHLRYSMSAGFDAWNGDHRKAAAIGGAIERRWFEDRAAVEVHATDWMGVGSSPGFQAAGVRLNLQSSSERHGWVALGTAGADRVSDRAPIGLWPGAGDGHARAPLLRAHPLLEDGVIDLGSSSVFGRSLSYGSVEAQHWFDKRVLARVGLAGFADVARATRRAAGDASPTHVDVGAGVRLRIPGAVGVLRADVAHGVRDGVNAFTFGWQF